MKRSWLVVLCLLLVTGMFRAVPAYAHPKRISGLVLSVLEAQRRIVVRPDSSGSPRAVTTLYRVLPSIDLSSVRAGYRIVALIDDDSKPPVIDDARFTAPAPPKSIIRNVIPLQAGDEMPNDKFVDQRGRPFTFADFRGKSVFLAFIYTRCKDEAECPLVSAHFGVLQRMLKNGPYHLVEMTLDPGFDTPAVLATYGKRFGADPNMWTFGTGNPDAVLDFDARFGIDPFADPTIGLIHTESGVLIDPHGKIVDLVQGTGWNPSDIAARLRPSKLPDSLALLDYYLSRITVAICGNGATGFNGLEDLGIILAILGSVGYVLTRLARFFLVHE